MADKKIKLLVAGQEVDCNFGVNYFYKHYKEVTGVDILVDGLKGLTSTEMFDVVASLYYAGYLAECSLSKKAAGLTKEEFDDLVLSSDEEGVGKMVNDYAATIKVETGEDQAQTESL